jgi:hypothetical protein
MAKSNFGASAAIAGRSLTLSFSGRWMVTEADAVQKQRRKTRGRIDTSQLRPILLGVRMPARLTIEHAESGPSVVK